MFIYIARLTVLPVMNMCGIVGFISSEDENAGRLLLDGLRKLEYRGYDSAGIAVINDSSMQVEKEVGTLDAFEKAVDVDEIYGTSGISHTRWATHGMVTKQNAHPHLSCDGKIAVVHNGIIENFQELYAELKGRHKFVTQTDTEVIAHLIEDNMANGQNFRDAFANTLSMLKGSYALLAASPFDKNIILAAKNESPLILGKAEGKAFAASDPMPLLKHTRDMIFMDDGEFAVLTPSACEVFSISSGNKVQKQVTRIDWSAAGSEKGIFPHFMLKEIFEQPQSLKKSLEQPYGAVEEFARAINEAKGVMIIACGTALHSAMCGQYLLDKISGKHVNVTTPPNSPIWKPASRRTRL